MTTSILKPGTQVTTAFASDGSTHPARRTYSRTASDGKNALVLEGVPVFRSGTFRDSMGDQATWEDLHIRQIVTNFEHLQSTHVFEDVPVRKGHTSFFDQPMDGLIGYVTKLAASQAKSPVDGANYMYLFADYEILDPDAQAKISSGLWRNRSAEVGHFVNNDEAMFWPTLVGFAYVDIPAVEGLNFGRETTTLQRLQHEFGVVRYSGGDSPMAVKVSDDKVTPPPTAGQPPTVEEPKVEEPAAEEPKVEEPKVKDASSGDAIPVTESQQGPIITNEVPRVEKEETGEAAPIEVTEVVQPPVFSAAPGATFVFSINGAAISDPAVVQRHISVLEQAARERVTADRKGFVTSLASSNRILASDIDKSSAFALSLSDEQFAAWKGTFDSAPALGVFGQHGVVTDQQSGDANDFEVALEIVQRHKASNLKPEAIRETTSYKRMVELGKSLGREYPKI